MSGLSVKQIPGARPGKPNYGVFDGDEMISGISGNHGAALTRMGHLEVERRPERKMRPCLTYPEEFMSKGIHNRLCPACRKRSADAVMFGV